MKSVLTQFSLSVLFLAAANGSTIAQTNMIIFVDGSYTEICEYAARNLGDPFRVEITGTRLDASPVELCTLAIREDASTYNRASNFNNRGVLLFHEGKLAEALWDFDQAMGLQNNLARAYANRGLTLVAMERWEEAVEALDRGIALRAEETTAALDSGSELSIEETGIVPEQDLEREVEETAKAYFSRAIAHEELGHLREAYRDYRKAAELAPQWEAPRLELTRFRVREPEF